LPKPAVSCVCRARPSASTWPSWSKALGVQLLNRTTRHASPNEHGQTYFERARAVLSEIGAADQAVAYAQSTPSGLLRINAPMSFGTLQLGPAIVEFMERYPDLKLQVVLSDDLLDPVQDGFDVTHVAIRGRGVALIPTFIAGDALGNGTLRAVLQDYPAPPLTLYAIYPPTRHVSVKVRLFIDFVVERFKH
jgi:DNA-binding transcriptional LysR family regulator